MKIENKFYSILFYSILYVGIMRLCRYNEFIHSTLLYYAYATLCSYGYGVSRVCVLTMYGVCRPLQPISITNVRHMRSV